MPGVLGRTRLPLRRLGRARLLETRKKNQTAADGYSILQPRDHEVGNTKRFHEARAGLVARVRTGDAAHRAQNSAESDRLSPSGSHRRAAQPSQNDARDEPPR